MRRVLRVRVVDLLGDASAADAMGAPDVDDFRIRIGDDREIVQFTLPIRLRDLAGPDPATLAGAQRVVAFQGIFTAFRPAARRAHGPTVDLVAASDDAIVTTGRDDVCIFWRQRDLVGRLIKWL